MKRLILTLGTIGALASAYGQGIIVWGNAAGTDADNLVLGTRFGLLGDMPVRTPGDTTTYYIAALFVSATDAWLRDPALPPIAYGTNSAGIPGKLTVPNAQAGVAGGTTLFFQVRAWSFNMGGTDWATVYANVVGSRPGTWYGESGIGQVVVQEPPNIPQNVWTTATVPIDGFQVYGITPEPNSIALVGLGSAALVGLKLRRGQGRVSGEEPTGGFRL
jgi:hypothetical protein